MKIYINTVDKLFFAAGVLIFLQAPAFVNQYTHRIIGYHEALTESANRYQSIADTNYQGDIKALINDFKKNSNEAIQRTGEDIADSIKQSKIYRDDYLSLTQNSLFKNIFYIVTHLRINLIKSAAKTYQPNITLNLDAIICGLFGGVFFSFIFHTLIYCCRLSVRRLRYHESSQV